jgi:hypothetical protein
MISQKGMPSIFISKQNKGEESKIVERARESEHERASFVARGR